MTSSIGLFLSIISIASYAYNIVLLKEEEERIVHLFWVSLFTYFGYLTVYMVSKQIFHYHEAGFEEFLYNVSFVNIPLYFLMALSWIASAVLMNKLIDKFDISTVMPLIKTSIIFTTLGYFFLGQKISLITFASVSLIALGGIVSGITKIVPHSPYKTFASIPDWLLLGGILEAFLDANGVLITFLCTHKTTTTIALFEWLNNTTHHIYALPFSFRHPFYYNTGVRLFITVLFFIYLVVINKHKKLISELIKSPGVIFSTSFLLLLSTVAYHGAYQSMLNKDLLALLRKGTIIPFILIISHYTLNEKITPAKLTGCLIILIGAFLGIAKG